MVDIGVKNSVLFTLMKTKAAIKFFGSKVALARALGIQKSAVSQWRENVPPRRAYELEQITGGKLKAPSLPEQQT